MCFSDFGFDIARKKLLIQIFLDFEFTAKCCFDVTLLYKSETFGMTDVKNYMLSVFIVIASEVVRRLVSTGRSRRSRHHC